MKTKVTDYKTKKINTFTGGTVGDWHENNETLPNSFISPIGVYIGDYGAGWFYFKENMLVCRDKANGVAVKLNGPSKDYPFWSAYKENGDVDCDHIEGFFAYKGEIGVMFKIGDRLFNPGYVPKKEDYTKEQWTGFKVSQSEFVQKQIENIKESDKIFKVVTNNPVENFIPLNLRGTIIIEKWAQAKEAAINLVNSL